MTIGIAAGQFADIANNANTASSATYTFNWPDTLVPQVTSFSVVNDDTLTAVTSGTNQSSVSYSIEAQFSEVVTAVDGVSVLTAVQNQIAGEPAIGEFTNITFSTNTDNTGQLDASFIINQGSNAYTGVNATQILITLPFNVVQDSAGNKNTNTRDSEVFTYVPSITSTGTASEPQSLTPHATPSAITAAINTTGGGSYWAYFQFDVQANKYYTITTSSPTNTTEQVTTITRPIITIYDSTFTSISQTENYIQQNYQATSSSNTSNLSLNYPYTVSSSDNTTKTPSGTTGSGTIYFVVDATNSANQNVAGSIGGYFQIAVTEVDIAAVPVVETITLNAYQPGSIVYDSVRNQAYDVWQVNLENNKSYRFETSQLGVSANTNISLYYNQENDANALEYARENSSTNRVGTNDDGGDNSYSKLDYTTSNEGTYYLRVEEFGNDADASYNLLTTLTSSFLTPHLNYNRNIEPNTNATNVLIYGYGTSEISPSSSYNNSTDPLYDYFDEAGVPYALKSYIASSGVTTNEIQNPTSDEKTAIKNALEAWTYPMGMPIYEFDTTDGATGANGQLHNAANFKIYIINSDDSVLNGLQGLAYPPGYSGSNGTSTNAPIIMMEGYILFVRNQTEETAGLWANSLLPGGYGYNVILHEFGHAFGFAHPFDTGGGSSGIFPGVDASNALIPDDYNTFRLGEQNYNQNAGTVMAYTNTYKYNQFNFYLGEDATAYVTNGGLPIVPEKYFQITPTTLDLAVLMTLYNYPRDSAQTGSKRYYLDPTKNTSTHVGWTTITDRLTGSTDKIILDASNIESDVVLDLRRPLIQVWDSTSSSYNSVDASDVELMRFSYAMPLFSVTYNLQSNEPDVPQTPNVNTTGFALDGGFSFSQVARAPGGIDAIGPTDPNTVNPSCLIYSNLGVETSNADTSSGPASGPGNFVDGTGKSNINGGKVKTDSTGITSVVYSKLASSFLNYYDDVPTNWQNTYYFDINDTDNTIGVYLGNGARYNPSEELDPIPTSFSHGYDEIATNTITQFVFNNYNFPSEPVSVVPVDSVCLAEGSEVMVWNINTKESYYKEIQNITEDDYVVTYGHGPKKVIGVTKSYNLPVNTSTWEKKKPGKLSKTQAMYHLSKDDFPELKKDLYLTGGHSILKPEMSKSERKEMNKIDWPRKFRQVDGLWKVLTYCTSKAKPVNKLTKVYNLVLEQEDMNDMFKNYGIYANGLLVESCNIQHIIRVKKLEDMMSRDRKMKEGLIKGSRNNNKQEKKAICN